MRLTRFFAIGLFTFTFGLATACHDDTAPRPTPFDAPHALATVDPLAAVLDQPTIVSFGSAESFFEGFFRSAITPSIAVAPARGRFAPDLARSLAAVARVNPTAIPDNAKGKTFVFDANAGSYAPDPTAVGAPADGVRFVLYVWEPGLGHPAFPLARIGYVDIGPASANVAPPEQTRIVIVRDEPRATLADFVTSHSAVAGINSFGISGSATDGSVTMNVALDGTESGDAGEHRLEFNSTFSSAALGISVKEQLTYDQAPASQGGRLDLTYEGHALALQSNPAGSEVRFDGRLYARILSPEPGQTEARYLSADGTPLTQKAAADLNALLVRVVAANFFWIGLAFP